MILLDIVRHIAALKRCASHIGLPTVPGMLRRDSPHGGEPCLTDAGRRANVLWHHEDAGSVQIGRQEGANHLVVMSDGLDLLWCQALVRDQVRHRDAERRQAQLGHIWGVREAMDHGYVRQLSQGLRQVPYCRQTLG